MAPNYQVAHITVLIHIKSPNKIYYEIHLEERGKITLGKGCPEAKVAFIPTLDSDFVQIFMRVGALPNIVSTIILFRIKCMLIYG